MHIFYDKFFELGWSFFYRMVLTILDQIKDDILEQEELWEILHSIKSTSFSASSCNSLYNKKVEEPGLLMKMISTFKEDQGFVRKK
jgi:hypothetical protein